MRHNTFAAATARNRSVASLRTREIPRTESEFDQLNWVGDTGEGSKLTKFFVYPEVFDTWVGEAERLYAEACGILEERGWDLFDETGALVFKAGLAGEGVVFKGRYEGFIGFREKE